MAVALRGSVTSATTTNATSFTVSKPTGVVSGDVIVIWVLTAGATASSITGFSGATASALCNEENLKWRVADGTEGSSFTITGPSGAGLAICAAFSGADGGSPVFDPNNPAASATASATNTSPSIAGFENSSSKATTVNGAMELWLLDIADLGTGTPAVTYPSGFTGTTVVQAAALAGGLAYFSQSSAGTAGTQAGSITGTSGTVLWALQLVAIKATGSPPAAGPFIPRSSRVYRPPLPNPGAPAHNDDDEERVLWSSWPRTRWWSVWGND